MRRLTLFLVITILLTAALTGLFAQGIGAQIEGIVSDATGLPLPNAQVTLSEVRTGLSRTSATTDAGTFQFPGLNPGQYQLTVKAQGFTTDVRGLTLEVSQALRADVSLKVGQVTQHVDVVSSAQMLRTADASLGEVIEPALTSQLPLNGGHLLDLAELAPSVHQAMGAQSGTTNPLYWRPQQNSALSVGGSRPNANNFRLCVRIRKEPQFTPPS
ncbi:MAG: carboxypeptidase-like regulatory domain-containing protein [Terriglobia bacterium]